MATYNITAKVRATGEVFHFIRTAAYHTDAMIEVGKLMAADYADGTFNVEFHTDADYAELVAAEIAEAQAAA